MKRRRLRHGRPAKPNLLMQFLPLQGGMRYQFYMIDVPAGERVPGAIQGAMQRPPYGTSRQGRGPRHTPRTYWHADAFASHLPHGFIILEATEFYVTDEVQHEDVPYYPVALTASRYGFETTEGQSDERDETTDADSSSSRQDNDADDDADAHDGHEAHDHDDVDIDETTGDDNDGDEDEDDDDPDEDKDENMDVDVDLNKDDDEEDEEDEDDEDDDDEDDEDEDETDED